MIMISESEISLALSIRQPWAWLIANGWKDIENRDWPTRFRGRFWIHAGKGMTVEEYEDCADMAEHCIIPVTLPPFELLWRGGIVGTAELVDCVEDHPSYWFCGRYGFVIRNAATTKFMPCKGALGFFRPDILSPKTKQGTFL